MRASELLAVRKQNGCTARSLAFDPMTEALREGKDYEVRTTPELIALSLRHERENLPFTPPPPTCTSCSPKSPDATADWVKGHRPGWWVCAQCKTVLPCRCEVPDELGCCTECGRLMSDQAIHKYESQACPVRTAESEPVVDVRGWEGWLD